MLVEEAMTPARVVLTPDMPVQAAAAALVENGLIAAPVVDDAGVLAGIVTEIDLLRDRFEPDPRASARPVAEPEGAPPQTVSQVMTRAVVTTTENSDVAELSERMVHSRIRTVPVLRAGRVVGMVGRGDLLRAHTRTDEQIHADLVDALANSGPYLHGWKIRVHNGVARLTGGGTAPDEHLVATIARTVPGVARVVIERT
ncbi:CBS domain-containing protein [Allosalinactinospora lopnorensis]|uniref:CBS domain-containing protein n=1 Tax=Allosalinactinospora lopnorensis TaxID=1352348 RepID=UPI000623CFF1|nr:CBS domain-containing protein [Allosalinactinospora lopnorensis]